MRVAFAAANAALLVAGAGAENATMGNATKLQRLCPSIEGGVGRIWQNAVERCEFTPAANVTAPLNEAFYSHLGEGCSADPYTFPRCPSPYAESTWPACDVLVIDTQENSSNLLWCIINLLAGLTTTPIFIYRLVKFRQSKKRLSPAKFAREKLVQQWSLGLWMSFTYVISGIDLDGRQGMMPRVFASSFLVESRTASISMFVIIVVFNWVAMFSAKGKKVKLDPKLEVVKYGLMCLVFANMWMAQGEYGAFDGVRGANENKVMNGRISAAKLLIGASILLPTVTGATGYALKIVAMSTKTVAPAAGDSKSGGKKKKQTGAGGKRLLRMLGVMWFVVAGGMGYMVLNAISRIGLCLFFDRDPEAYWFNIPNALHIMITLLVVVFFRLPSTKKKGQSTVTSSGGSSGGK